MGRDMSQPPSIGDIVEPWGKVEAIQWDYGERYYFLVNENGDVAYLPASVVEPAEVIELNDRRPVKPPC